MIGEAAENTTVTAHHRCSEGASNGVVVCDQGAKIGRGSSSFLLVDASGNFVDDVHVWMAFCSVL